MNIWEQNAQRWQQNAQRWEANTQQWIQNEQRRTAPPPNQIKDQPKQQPTQSRQLIRPPAPKPISPPPPPVYQGWGKPQLRDLPVFQSPVSLKDALILGVLFLAWRTL